MPVSQMICQQAALTFSKTANHLANKYALGYIWKNMREKNFLSLACNGILIFYMRLKKNNIFGCIDWIREKRIKYLEVFLIRDPSLQIYGIRGVLCNHPSSGNSLFSLYFRKENGIFRRKKLIFF